jgi:hypothetical protein
LEPRIEECAQHVEEEKLEEESRRGVAREVSAHDGAGDRNQNSPRVSAHPDDPSLVFKGLDERGAKAEGDPDQGIHDVTGREGGEMIVEFAMASQDIPRLEIGIRIRGIFADEITPPWPIPKEFADIHEKPSRRVKNDEEISESHRFFGRRDLG